MVCESGRPPVGLRIERWENPAISGESADDAGLHAAATTSSLTRLSVRRLSCLQRPLMFFRLGACTAPTITAFEKDETVSLAGTRAFVRFLLAQGVDGLVPLGSSGEPLALTMTERKAVLDAVMAEAGGKVPILAGVVEYSTRAAIEFGGARKICRVQGAHGDAALRLPAAEARRFRSFTQSARSCGASRHALQRPGHERDRSLRRKRCNNWQRRVWCSR